MLLQLMNIKKHERRIPMIKWAKLSIIPLSVFFFEIRKATKGVSRLTRR
jgi:hypothetical protein